MKKLLLTLGIILISILTNGQETKYVDTDVLNIRSGAGTKYEVVDKISHGQKVTVLSKQGKWSEIELENGTKGFVSTKFLSDKITSTNSSNSSKKNSWTGYIIVIGIIIYVLYKIMKFFSGGSSSSSSSPRRDPRPEITREISSNKPKVNLLRWYHCKNCNIKIEAGKQPTSVNCSSETFHQWTDLGEVGNQAYSCKNCGTTVYTTKQPTSVNCSRDTFHKWTKLS